MSDTLNPDFRGADEVIVPANAGELMGYTQGGVTEQEAYAQDQAGFDAFERDYPLAMRDTPSGVPMPEIYAKWQEFQKSKGRYDGSADWTLLDEFVLKRDMAWLPQIIGSCVLSNTFRLWTIRLMYQIVILGEPHEYLGRDEFGTNNMSFYGPMSYGLARRRAKMKGGDGLYCRPMAESLVKDGVLMCNTPALKTFLEGRGLGDSRDYPEPQGNDGARLYREFGNWLHLDSFTRYLDFPVTSTPRVTSAQQLWDKLGRGQGAFKCSSEAIRKVGTHPDGFAIHARDPRNSWAHNMAWHGRFVASDGSRWFRESNKSWGANHVYNRRFEEVDRELGRGGITAAFIDGIRGPASSPPQL